MFPNVLVVEPYADLRAGIVAALQKLEYSCVEVESADDAVLALNGVDYAYVVLDIENDRAPSAHLVDSLDAATSVILITDRDPRDVSAGHAVVLRKPFAREELVAHFAH